MREAGPSRLTVLFVAILSQAGWFAAVLGAAHGLPWAGPAFALLAVPAGAIMLRGSRRILLLAIAAMVVGLAVETVMTAQHFVAYREPGPFAPLPPMWLLSLWAMFALVIETALTAFSRRPLVQAGLAAVGGPLAYLAGEKLGAMEFLEPRTAGLTLLAVLWAIALPVLMWVRERSLAPARA